MVVNPASPLAAYAPPGECRRFAAVRESAPPAAPKPRLLDRVREALRIRHYSRRTEEAYIAWIRRYILFHNKRHPAEMGAPEVTRFLTSLAVDGKVAASTQNQALSALLFLYRQVLEIDLPWLDEVVRAKRPQRLPVVLARQEVQALLQPLTGVPRLMAYLLYGSGLRLLECCRLRVQDVDFAANHIVVRTGKGDKDRVTVLPAAVKAALARHLDEMREQHQRDLRLGAGWVELPTALMRKYPNAGREWVWQWVFPATRLYIDREHRPAPSAPPPRDRPPARGEGRGPPGRHPEAGHTPHPAPLVRDPHARRWLRHPDRPRAARTPRRDHDPDLHARPEPRPGGSAEPGGPDARGVSPMCREPARTFLDRPTELGCAVSQPNTARRVRRTTELPATAGQASGGRAGIGCGGPQLSRAQRRAMRPIETCRTAALGGHRETCDTCGAERIASRRSSR